MSAIISPILNLLIKLANFFRSKVKNTLAIQSWSKDKSEICLTNISGERIVLKKIIYEHNCSIKDFCPGWVVDINDVFYIYFNNIQDTKRNVSFIIKCSIGNDNDRYCLVSKKGDIWLVE